MHQNNLSDLHRFIDRPAPTWSGRNDGAGTAHRRVHQAVTFLGQGSPASADAIFIGFASDEGVRRNVGRQGAADGPAALRSALGRLALAQGRNSTRHTDLALLDAGDIVVSSDLEEGQKKLAAAVMASVDAGVLPVVLGGGHEVAFGTYTGVADSRTRKTAGCATSQELGRLGILNLDAHFDVRRAEQPTSGTPFYQALTRERAAGTSCRYTVLGISEANNTQELFDTAHELGADYVVDEDCGVLNQQALLSTVREFVASVDIIYLTLDLDVLPASIAPGVSAPAGYGVPLEIINVVLKEVATSGKLAAFDVAELNPSFDSDGRTAQTAARLIHTVLTYYTPLSSAAPSLR